MGEGGHGQVWEACSSDGETRAFKVVKDLDAEIILRLRREVAAQRALSDVQGVMPIHDFYIPDSAANGPAWIAMDLAQPIQPFLANLDIEGRIEALRLLSVTLVEIHRRGYAHRDIKPDNVLVVGGRPVLSDFGLVDVPEKTVHTPKGKRIGNFATIAPEMRRKNSNSEGAPADVFSFGKTIWMILADSNEGFEGEYSPSVRSALTSKYPSAYLAPINAILADATRLAPGARPTIKDVSGRLQQWVDESKDFRAQIRAHWESIQTEVAGSAASAVWSDPGAIAEVLGRISSAPRVHHAMLPDGGGLDLHRVSLDRGVLKLDFGDGVDFEVLPKLLHLRRYPHFPDSSFFFLEAGHLPYPTGEGKDERQSREYAKFPDGSLADVSHYYDRQWEGRPTPEGTRVIRRAYGGAFLFVMRASPYNDDLATYDGRHSKVPFEEFEKYYERRYVRPAPPSQPLDAPRYVVEDASWKSDSKNVIPLSHFTLSAVRDIVSMWPRYESSGDFEIFDSDDDEQLAREGRDYRERRTTLDSVFEGLSDDQIVELCALMYLGRDTRGERVIPDRWRLEMEYFVRDRREDLEQSLKEKYPAPEYIEAGLKSLGYSLEN